MQCGEEGKGPLVYEPEKACTCSEPKLHSAVPYFSCSQAACLATPLLAGIRIAQHAGHEIKEEGACSWVIIKLSWVQHSQLQVVFDSG